MAWFRQPTMTAPLGDRAAIRYLGAFGVLAAAPHFLEQPWWVSGIFVVALTWRTGVEQRGWPPVGRGWRFLLALLVAVLVVREYHTVLGRDPGFALLLGFAGLKLLETRSERDYRVSATLYFVLIGGSFLYEQSIARGALALLAVVAGVITMVRLTQPRGYGFGEQWRLAVRLTAQAVPLMLVLYFLFPRLHGTLWGLPVDGAAARAGLSDRMQPGSVSELLDSGETAFRASFSERVPEPGERYWRALVLWHTTGKSWEQGRVATGAEGIEGQAAPLAYEVMLEASDRPYLPALDMPVSGVAEARLRAGRVLERNEPVRDRLHYQLASFPRYRVPALAAAQRVAALQLPEALSERVRGFATQLRDQHGGGRALADALLAHFRSENFVYTLRPPRLDDDPVDGFLFETRRGFCEHYASAFVTLMRAAGVPARVVLGYLGGEHNAAGNYLIVRQSDAHAWAEIWIEGEGWVRVDPTAAVAPERVELGIEALRRLDARGLSAGTLAASALAQALELGFLERSWLRARLTWDLANLTWYRWVMDYTPERQAALLARLGLERVTRGQLLGSAFGVAATILLVYGLWGLRGRSRPDPAQAEFLRLCRKLARIGLVRAPHEGARAFAVRVARARPDLAPSISQSIELYETLRYAPAAASAATLRALRERVAALRC